MIDDVGSFPMAKEEEGQDRQAVIITVSLHSKSLFVGQRFAYLHPAAVVHEPLRLEKSAEDRYPYEITNGVDSKRLDCTYLCFFRSTTRSDESKLDRSEHGFRSFPNLVL